MERLSGTSEEQFGCLSRITDPFLIKKLERFGINAVGAILLTGFEETRSQFVNPKSGGMHTEKKAPLLSPEHPAFEPLSHMGDLFDGYWQAMVIYAGLSIIDACRYFPTGRKIPYQLKLGVATIGSSAIVTAAETGIIHFGTPDTTDIPAGIVGAVIYATVNIASRKKLNIGSKVRKIFNKK